jgi:hypothetical protein
MEMQRMPVEVFYSCSDSPNDAPLREQLERHLNTLQREGWISIWSKRQIAAGHLKQKEHDRPLIRSGLSVL